MRFGRFALADAEGALLAHPMHVGDRRLDKGMRLEPGDLAALAAAGLTHVFAARLDADDVGEDEAAALVAGACLGPGLEARAALGGRVDLVASRAGLFRVDRAAVDRLNGIDEAVTLATLEADRPVASGDRVATIKIIPFAVRRAVLDAVAAVGLAGALTIAPFRRLRVALVQTRLPHVADKVFAKTHRTVAARLERIGARLDHAAVVDHTIEAVAAELGWVGEAVDLVLIVGASAVGDRADVAPAAILEAGGAIERFGMPVEPGNLLVLARLGAVPVVVLPGCARSPADNGLDAVLHRLAAGVPLGAAEVGRMGVGGLLAEARASRPAAKPVPRPAPRLAAVILAAGRSTRMLGDNKLTRPFAGRPMIDHPIRAALEAGFDPIVVVTGHEHERIEAIVEDLPVEIVHNRRFAEGLSTSLSAGLEALPATIDGAVVMLGDMPEVGAAHLRGLASAFAPDAGRSIVVPTAEGRWGNPMLWGRVHFAAMTRLRGDRGARRLAEARRAHVVEVPFGDDAVHRDYDTPAAWAAAEPPALAVAPTAGAPAGSMPSVPADAAER